MNLIDLLRNTVLLIAVLSFGSLSTFAQSSWEVAKEKSAVKVYTKDNPGSSVKASKASVIINATVDDALNLLRDFENYPSWMYECSEGKLLKEISEEEYYVYTITDAPWPVTDRDLIVHVKASEAADGTVTLNMEGAADFIEETKGLVRVPEFKGAWILKPLKEGQIEVTYKMANHPGGSIPDWVANMTATDIPLFTLIEMKKSLER